MRLAQLLLLFGVPLLGACQTSTNQNPSIVAPAQVNQSTNLTNSNDIAYPQSVRAAMDKRNQEIFDDAVDCTIKAAILFSLTTEEGAPIISSVSLDRCRQNWDLYVEHNTLMKWKPSASAPKDVAHQVIKEVMTPRIMRAVLEARAQRALTPRPTPAPPPANVTPPKKEYSI